MPNNFDAQHQATRYLIDRGYQKPLCFWLPEAEAANHDRREGFEHTWQTTGRSLSDASQHHMMVQHVVDVGAGFPVHEQAADIAFHDIQRVHAAG
ncbi:hypothetical protein [Pectobacterium versatile]|uniref:hypothetical protein n=1 Tax=Pectobacterium versatile TaxID=2488639 RepID=UPI001CCE733A